MNRILFEPGEITDGVVRFGGERAEHVLGVLHGEVGQTLKTGIVGGKIGTSVITSIDDGFVSAAVTHDAEPLPSWADLVLAPPRPRAFKRLLPQLATMGVGRVVLVGAEKVEKDFWGATILKEKNFRPLLTDGLMQGGVATELPMIEIRRGFRRFVRDELETIFPDSRRIVAHPYSGPNPSIPQSVNPPILQSSNPPILKSSNPSARLLLAVGPEGGWTDDEVALLEEHGFIRLSLGRRILRTETAVIALLSRLSTSSTGEQT